MVRDREGDGEADRKPEEKEEAASEGRGGKQEEKRESLNVIALISGGKDSFFSLLHCLRNGHRVVALGNLYPPSSSPDEHVKAGNDGEEVEEEKDLNSFMYQTVGHTIIPVYEQALGIPLYRQEILGEAVQTGTSYACPLGEEGRKDETESLVPLLKRIMEKHPEANAMCSGAILSTYQRTRIESVALRLGLVPLAYLWQYPSLPPHRQTSLLEDMYQAGLEARIVKVASGGLDEGWLWERVSDSGVIGRMESRLRRFGMDGNGAVIGEGGEYETVVVDGPRALFKGRLEVRREEMEVVREGGGSAWLRIGRVEVVTKEGGQLQEAGECRIPDVLEQRFGKMLKDIGDEPVKTGSIWPTTDREHGLLRLGRPNLNIHTSTFSANSITSNTSISEETSLIITSIRQFLQYHTLTPTNIISSIILLRSMSDFQAVNQIYSKLFPQPNPPSRITISCGTTLPPTQNLQIHLSLYTPPLILTASPEQHKRALHVQSRSYWAPANIGPYSQAMSYAVPPSKPASSPFSTPGGREEEDVDDDGDEEIQPPVWLVKIAGQIPLLPSSMTLPTPSINERETFKYETVLALQHLWRIGVVMDVKWFAGGIVYIPSPASSSLPEDLTSAQKAKIVGKVWRLVHQQEREEDEEGDEEGEEMDVWHQRNNYSRMGEVEKEAKEKKIPEWDLIQDNECGIPPVFTVEVESLPRDSGVEWHALSGIGMGARRIVPCIYTSPEGDFTIHHLTTNSFITHTIVSILLCSEQDVLASLDRAKKLFGVSTEVFQQTGTLMYRNAKCTEICQILREGESKWKGVIPCKGIWDADGREVAGVWVLEGVLL